MSVPCAYVDLLDWPLIFWPRDPTRPVSVSLAGKSDCEALARDQLLSILNRYDLDKWRLTNRVRIQHFVVPHSHPVLTLNTRYLDDDACALSTYLHEQLHWFLAPRRKATRQAMADLKRRYPDTPAKPPAGARDLHSSYLHYVVCYLEYAALIDVLGPEEARRVIDFWCADHYTEIYKTVLRDYDAIGEIVARHGLLP